MTPLNAFVTPGYPVLYTLIPGGESGVPQGHAGVVIGLLIHGVPSFLSTVLLPEDEIGETVESLHSGDVRVAVVGLPLEGAGPPAASGECSARPAAFVSLLCSDGRRMSLTRILGSDPEGHPDALARLVIRQIARGVQIPDLATAP
jgi:hypothetical protein